MYFFLTILATIFYALNNIFLTPIARKEDPVVVSAYRGIALGLMSLPFFLYWYGGSIFDGLEGETFFLICIACVSTAMGNAAFYMSSRYLPVGIASTVCLAFSTLMLIALSLLFFNESISIIQGGCILCSVLLVVGIGLCSQRNSFSSLDVYRGTAYAFLFGVFLGTGYFLVGMLSRTIDPLRVGFFWEAGIGICGYIYIFLRNLITSSRTIFSVQTFYRIGIAASPTVVGTACFSLATSLGPMTIVAAILPLISVFTSIFAGVFLKEYLSKLQWMFVLLLVCCISGLKYFGQ